MFIIIKDEYFDEILVDTDVVGYFKTYEKAKQNLISEGFQRVTIRDSWFEDGYFESEEYDLIREDILTDFKAIIIELEEITNIQ